MKYLCLKSVMAVAAVASMAGCVTPPLDDLAALQVGRGLARLAGGLHAEGFALGALKPADVELAADGAPRLRDVHGMRRIPPDDTKAAAADLQALAALLEALTNTERATKRLNEDQATTLLSEPGLQLCLGHWLCHLDLATA